MRINYDALRAGEIPEGLRRSDIPDAEFDALPFDVRETLMSQAEDEIMAESSTKRIPSSDSTPMVESGTKRIPSSHFKPMGGIPSRHESFERISANAELPPFPVDVMDGGAMELYRSAFGEFQEVDGKRVWVGRNEMNFPYMFASAIVQVGAVMGRSVWVEGMPSPLYPNVYVMLIGKTAAPRKSTAMGMAVKHAKGVVLDGEHPLQVISSVSTAEGLVHQLRTSEMRRVEQDVEDEQTGEMVKQSVYVEKHLYDNLGQFEGIRLLIQIDEILSTFSKRQQQSSAGIIAMLTELYSMPEDVRNTSKTAGEIAEYPCVSTIGCSTEAWFGKGIRTEDILGGFANRQMYFSAVKPPKPIAFAEPPDARYIARWNEHLVALRMEFQNHQKFTLSDEVRQAMSEAYAADFERMWESEDDLINAASARSWEHILKLALIFTLTDTPVGNTIVGIKQYRKAEAVGAYLTDSNLHLFSNIVSDRDAEMEQKILSVLNDKFGGVAPKRELRRSISARSWPSKRYNSAIDALEQAEQIAQVVDDNGSVRVYAT